MKVISLKGHPCLMEFRYPVVKANFCGFGLGWVFFERMRVFSLCSCSVLTTS